MTFNYAFTDVAVFVIDTHTLLSCVAPLANSGSARAVYMLFVLIFLATFQIKPPTGELFEVAGTLCQIILFRFIDTEKSTPPHERIFE